MAVRHSTGSGTTATDFDESPEGHALRFDTTGALVGITLLDAKRLLEAGQPIVVTIPERLTIDPAALAPAIEPAA